MNRIAVVIVALGLSLACIPSGWAAEANPEQAKVIAEINKLRGTITVDEKSPDKRVIGVSLCNNIKVTDEGLAHLKVLTNLQTLILRGTKVTDTGLAYIEGLTTLQSLNLGYTKVTDTGVAHLKGLINLQVLVLGDT
ncbi:MAG: hypothetical protein ABSG53_13335, partial [Thermoguttaceae bacterium]